MTLELHPDLVGLAGSKVELLISCTDLADLDEFTKSDPMCVLFFVESFVIDFEPSHSQQLMFSVYDIDSRWRPFELNLQRLCNGEWDRHIHFSCWHFSGSDYHLIGRKVTTLREMNNLPMNGHYKEVMISSPKKEKSSKKHTLAGQIRVDMKYSLLDFVRGGLQLNLMIAVDFTASNGDPNEDLSLHTIKDFRLVEETYEKILPNLQFSGPTRIAPVIEKAAAYAERENMCQDKQVYTVLLVITDGVINDINRTLRRIISTSHLPYSIIFVGVGPADFNLMEQFHTTQDCPLKREKTGETAVRSNTHFVAFRKENLLTGGNITL
ncbi:hypothetical protein KUTeg_006809, partial [Tegillarca granosa]